MSNSIKYGEKVLILIESLIITIIFIVVSKLLNSPLSLTSPYPWIWFAPALIGLHYGLLPSQFSIILLVGEYIYINPEQLYQSDFQLFILGGFVLTLICVVWQSSWSKKIIYSNSISEYLQKRIQTTANAYKLTTLAYQRLENNYIASPTTIRTSMNELRQLLSRSNEENQATILNRFINILAMHCSIERAVIFPVKDNTIIPEPITSIGSITTPDIDNVFIKQCIESAKMIYVRASGLINGEASDYVIGTPLINQNNSIYALLLIEELPFLSLNEENIATINLLVEYFMEGNNVKGAELILDNFPDCPVIFANEYQRLSSLHLKTKKDSSVEVFQFLDKLHQDDYIFRIKQEIRGLDSWWETTFEGVKMLLILMPFTNQASVESYKTRINTILFQEFNIYLNQNEIKLHSYQISSSKSSISLLKEIFVNK